MGTLQEIYRSSLGLLTDLYQLTMACGYWRKGLAERRAVFHLFFRRHPFRGGFTVAAGLASVVDFLEGFRFTDDDLGYLAKLKGNDGSRLFEDEFLAYLGRMRFTCHVDAMPEGTVVFPREPLVRVEGPLAQAQLLETPLLNLVNFQTLIATKAARVVLAAAGDPVLEFGLRRAQGIDGALSASRAAYIGGCAGTSNVLAGRLFGIPVRGTHAHSWVMCFDGEQEAFQAYAEAMPNNCVFLVDTYDTLQGVRHAVEVGRWLRAQGHEMIGIRLDSGDLADLSIRARHVLDEAGFHRAVIIASNDLDEEHIAALKQQGATVAVWGVGTRLATAYGDPALGGVYKLAALLGPDGQWRYKVKRSEQAVKATCAGVLQVRRLWEADQAVADVIYDVLNPEPDLDMMIDPDESERPRPVPGHSRTEELLTPVFRDGQRVGVLASLEEARRRARSQLEAFHPGVKRLAEPDRYPVGLEVAVYERTRRLLAEAAARCG
ncbi:MAG TPA: nicotinate phosphoribosyltransferase [Planctomycetaceae bacterium]|nr:nicotinate phosphoribosyltransferase [Planctomycetaceae bacterium]HIQ19777.1 nicotinate phosphoribosyltransferase [Planctomycetota bacterium]